VSCTVSKSSDFTVGLNIKKKTDETPASDSAASFSGDSVG